MNKEKILEQAEDALIASMSKTMNLDMKDMVRKDLTKAVGGKLTERDLEAALFGAALTVKAVEAGTDMKASYENIFLVAGSVVTTILMLKKELKK